MREGKRKRFIVVYLDMTELVARRKNQFVFTLFVGTKETNEHPTKAAAAAALTSSSSYVRCSSSYEKEIDGKTTSACTQRVRI